MRTHALCNRRAFQRKLCVFFCDFLEIIPKRFFFLPVQRVPFPRNGGGTADCTTVARRAAAVVVRARHAGRNRSNVKKRKNKHGGERG